jgi:hypothetical protein
MKQYVIRDAGGLAILEQACISRDRSTQFAVIIKRDGAMIRGKEAMKEHPLLKLEREERALECRLCKSSDSTSKPCTSEIRTGQRQELFFEAPISDLPPITVIRVRV